MHAKPVARIRRHGTSHTTAMINTTEDMTSLFTERLNLRRCHNFRTVSRGSDVWSPRQVAVHSSGILLASPRGLILSLR